MNSAAKVGLKVASGQAPGRQSTARVRLWVLWAPLSVLSMAALVSAVQRHDLWTVGLAAAAGLWALLALTGFSATEGLEGLSWKAVSPGFDSDIRAEGLLAPQLSPRAVKINVLHYVGIMAVALVVALAIPDAESGGAFFALVQVGLVSLTFEVVSVLAARRFGPRPSTAQLLQFAIPAGLCAAVLAALAVLPFQLVRPQAVHPLLYGTGALVAVVYLGALVPFNSYINRWQARLAKAEHQAVEADLGRKLAEAHLAVLQAQIEPHFLYNTLATVQYLVRSQPNTADFLLGQLIRYLRVSMPSMRQFSSTLGREFELTDAYLQIARLRMGGRLSVDMDVSTELEGLAFPTLVLQTLVENAIKHGIEPKTGPVHLSVSARRSGGQLVVSVRDDGVGLGGAPTQGHGTGLQNLRSRLQGIYGETASLAVVGLAEGGVLATVTLPIPREEAAEA